MIVDMVVHNNVFNYLFKVCCVSNSKNNKTLLIWKVLITSYCLDSNESLTLIATTDSKQHFV